MTRRNGGADVAAPPVPPPKIGIRRRAYGRQPLTYQLTTAGYGVDFAMGCAEADRYPPPAARLDQPEL